MPLTFTVLCLKAFAQNGSLQHTVSKSISFLYTDVTDMQLNELWYSKELVSWNKGFSELLSRKVIMDVTSAEQAQIAEKAGAVAVMALERVPSDIRKEGGVARAVDPTKVKEILDAVDIPVMAKARIGHFVEAQILEVMGVAMVDESEVLTPADEEYHINKKQFKIPFVCGARNLGEALRRIDEGAMMMRTKGEAGTGNVVEAVRHMRSITSEIRKLQGMTENELIAYARAIEAPAALVIEVAKRGRLPVVNYSAGGVATPADAALMMQLGADGVFVGSGIFKSSNPKARAEAIVKAVASYDNAKVIADVSTGLGSAMPGLDCRELPETQRYAGRGW